MKHLFYNKCIVKTKRSLFSIFKKYGKIERDLFKGNLKFLNKLFCLPETYSIDFVVKSINLYYKDKDNYIFKYIKKCGENNFSKKRYNEYKLYRKINSKDTFSEKYHRLIYGNSWRKYFILSRKRNSPLDPNYVSRRDNISIEEANLKIKKLKETYKTSKENFILKYGEQVGAKKYQEFVSKIAKNSIFSINYWVNLGYSEKDSKKLRSEFFKNNSSIYSVDFWQKRGLSASKAKQRVQEICSKRGVSFMSASKESLSYFKPINEQLVKIGYKPKFGVSGNEEFSLWNPTRKNFCFYDFTVEELKIIIEYNGDRFHPNPKNLNKKQWAEWRVPYSDKVYTADEIAKKDAEKMHLAIKNGYDYLVIWSSDSFEYNMKKIKDIFHKKNINIY